MSARDELPPGRRAVLGAAHRWELYEPRHDAPIRYAKREDAVAMAWRRFGIPREELATMRAAVARVAELEPELAMKTAALYSIAEAGLVFKLEAAKNEREAERARADKAEARVAELEVSFSAVDSDLGQAGSLMAAAQEFTRVVCELLGNEGSGMDVSTDVLQDMLTAAGVTR